MTSELIYFKLKEPEKHFIKRSVDSSSLLTKQLQILSFRLKVNEGPRRERGNADRGRQRDGRGRGRGRPEVIQSHSIFEQGPAEMMAKRRG